jgi:hypothetical protein
MALEVDVCTPCSSHPVEAQEGKNLVHVDIGVV